MLRRISIAAIGAAAMLVVAASPRAARAGQVENPLYAAWSKFKPGSSATIKHVMHMEGNGMNVDRDYEATSRLIEVTAEKVTVEASTIMAGRATTHKQELAATIDSNDKKVPKQLGHETITVGGKSYACKVFEMQLDERGALVHAKLWITDKVPGGVVKMESHVTQGDMKVTDHATLTQYEAK